MFSLYGNQYEDREECLLLSMFEVRFPDVTVAMVMTMDCHYNNILS